MLQKASQEVRIRAQTMPYRMRVASRLALALAALLLFSSGEVVASTGLASDPSKVKIVTSDIVQFWHAYDDAMKSHNLEKSFAYQYFAPGTKGLWGFVPSRLVSPHNLASVVGKNRAYYTSTRPYMMRITFFEKPQILANLYRYKTLYPQAVFPDVYFVVGALNSAGTSVDDVGLVIGSEMLSRPPKMTVQMPGFNTSVLMTTDQIPFVIAHEFTHYNQQDD